MLLRESLAALMALVLAHPAWGNANIVGNVASSESVSVLGATLTPGSTIFSGDTLEVGERGAARITLTGGAQVQLAENSLVRLTRTEKRVQVAIERGRATFRTTEDAPVEALLGDATIRSASGAPAVAVVYVRTPQYALIAADKGTLEIRTAHDGRAVNLREGEGMEVMLAAVAPAASSTSHGSAVPAGWSAGKIVILGAIVAGVATAIAIAINRNEARQDNPCLEVSPFNVNCR